MQNEELPPEKSVESDDQKPPLVHDAPAANLSDQDEKSITLKRAEYVEFSSGPLPHPQALKAYDMVVPGAAERIISMAERQQAHRHSLERTVIDGDTKRASLGLAAGALFAFSTLGAGIYLISGGHELSGVALFGTTLASVVGTFVYGTQSRKTEREERQSNLLQSTSQGKKRKEEP